MDEADGIPLTFILLDFKTLISDETKTNWVRGLITFYL